MTPQDALPVVGYRLKSGHGTHFKENLRQEFKELTFGGRPMWQPLVTLESAQSTILSLRGELEALRADAERYRWLRVNPVQCANFADDQTYRSNKHKPQLFDAAVDAARPLSGASEG